MKESSGRNPLENRDDSLIFAICAGILIVAMGVAAFVGAYKVHRNSLKGRIVPNTSTTVVRNDDLTSTRTIFQFRVQKRELIHDESGIHYGPWGEWSDWRIAEKVPEYSPDCYRIQTRIRYIESILKPEKTLPSKTIKMR